MPVVFLTGATGFVGRAVVRRLLSQGEEVRALYRNEKSRWIEDQKVEWVRGGIGSVDLLRDAMAGAEAVIHLAGSLIEPGGETFERVHVEGTGNVVEAMRRAGVRRLLQMSALGARPSAASRYHQTKWQAEEIVRAAPLQATVFRPSLLFGKEDRALNRLARLLPDLPFVPLPGPGENRLQPVWVEDVAACFVEALKRPETAGRIYPLCGPRAYTLNELVDLVLRIRRRRRPKVHLPLALLRGAAAVFERLLTEPPFTRDQLVLLQEENICSEGDAAQPFSPRFKGPEEILPTYLSA